MSLYVCSLANFNETTSDSDIMKKWDYKIDECDTNRHQLFQV